MKAQLVQQPPKVVLTLTVEEALWLKTALKEPIGCTNQEEYPDEKAMRVNFLSQMNTMGIYG